ncbi:amidohydrolase family protein [Shouchella miscanthi]|uniref:Amidohydrolase family protein n=1 Tax=Shouchella miscanthi TaxID=2598861 RepID=A0ABU6NNL4_9BACI|nr:amidohydrolase family protein [Shouchella miscanthi]
MKKTLIRGGTVLPVTKRTSYIEADILIEGTKISKIEPSIHDEDADIIDASNRIVMPGFVDSHRHTWESMIRNIGADWSLQTYLGQLYYGGIGSKRRPQDDYIGNLFGALEALDAGVTTILDWTMINSIEHAEEGIRGLQDAGIRAVFAYGAPGDEAFWNNDSTLTHTDDAKTIQSAYFQSPHQLLTLGLAIRGPEFSAWDTAVKEINTAREMGILATMHLGFGTWGRTAHSIERLDEQHLLGKDLNFTHMNRVTDGAMKRIAAKGGSVSVTPEVEMMMGHGYPATGLALENGVKPTLGVDVVTSTGGDMFAQMKFALQAERARVNEKLLDEGIMPGPELHLSANQILECATIEGAKALLLDDKIGSLEVGKEADILLLNTSDLNLSPITDPIGAVVQTAHPGNVDSVFVAGKAVKRHGQLLFNNLDSLRSQLSDAQKHVLAHTKV